ncbi:MAG TPA: ATP-binding protein [Streptosporangiaceae bacterium]|nr:ATP-binding protein [Streptosporangiaceae bacterium]
MRCPVLVGRSEPAALIDGAVRVLSARGDGGSLVLLGEAGIGKSRMAEQAGLAAQRAGLRVVTGRAAPGGLGGLLGPVAEVIGALARDQPPPEDPGLAPYLPVLAGIVPAWRAPGWSGPGEPLLASGRPTIAPRWPGWPPACADRRAAER